jgi:hypothetical protein
MSPTKVDSVDLPVPRLSLAMDWYACPDGTTYQLRVAPRLESWKKAGDPDQVRLQAYLDDTEERLAPSRIVGAWALRLDVGLTETRDLLEAAELDNNAYTLAHRLKDAGLVSVWWIKEQVRAAVAKASELLIYPRCCCSCACS